MIRDLENSGDLQGVHVCRSAPRVSHVFFYDDCFLFIQAEENQANVMKHILTRYKAVSGQAINLNKYEVEMSKNCCNNPLPTS